MMMVVVVGGWVRGLTFVGFAGLALFCDNAQTSETPLSVEFMFWRFGQLSFNPFAL